MHNAELQDLFLDENDKLWRVVMTCTHPTVTVEEVEPREGRHRERKGGSVYGQMWFGFRKLVKE